MLQNSGQQLAPEQSEKLTCTLETHQGTGEFPVPDYYFPFAQVAL